MLVAMHNSIEIEAICNARKKELIMHSSFRGLLSKTGEQD